MDSIVSSKRYSMYEVAQLLGIHVATVWRWYLHGIRGQKLSTVLIGGRRFVLAADLDLFLASGNQEKIDQTSVHRRAIDAGRILDAHGVKSLSASENGAPESRTQLPKKT